MKVLVTGCSSKLGPFVIRDLLAHDHEVVLCSRRPPAAEFGKLAWRRCELTDADDCARAVNGGVEAIQHLAAQPWPTDHPEMRAKAQELGLPADTTIRTNILGTYMLMQAAADAGVKTVVMTGSNCALGHGFRLSKRPFPFRYLPVDEQHPSDVEDSYSYSKLAGEELLASFTRAYGMRTYAVRAAGICPPDRRAAMTKGAGPSRGWNPWLWVWVGSEDVASAHRLLMEQAATIMPHGAFFCNADDSTALEPSRELVEKYRPDLLPLVRDLPGHASFLSNRRLQQTVGWRHQTTWRKA